MYNRYVPNDTGVYHRVEETPPNDAPNPPPHTSPPPNHVPPPKAAKGLEDGVQQFLRDTLDRFHLQDIDTGDLMLLALLFFLFHEDADEEVLFALGLLFIL